jgi:hypothetical protein
MSRARVIRVSADTQRRLFLIAQWPRTETCFLLDFFADLPTAFDHDNGFQPWPVVVLLQPFDIVDHCGDPGLDPVVIAIDRPVLADFAVLEADGFLLGAEDLDILTSDPAAVTRSISSVPTAARRVSPK